MRKYPWIIMTLLLIISLCACHKNIQSADLSHITFDGVSIGDRFDQVERSRYTVKSNVSDAYTYNYEEWRLSVEDGIITEIMASFGQICISVNGSENCRSIDDITKILGENHDWSWYDREQGLRQLQYVDEENGLQCSFAYAGNSKELVWVIVRGGR